MCPIASFATIPSLSSSALWAHESNCFGATRTATWNCPRLGTFKTVFWLPTKRNGENTPFVCFALCFWRFAAVRIARIELHPKHNRIARYNPNKWLGLVNSLVLWTQTFSFGCFLLLRGFQVVCIIQMESHRWRYFFNTSPSCNMHRTIHWHVSIINHAVAQQPHFKCEGLAWNLGNLDIKKLL